MAAVGAGRTPTSAIVKCEAKHMGQMRRVCSTVGGGPQTGEEGWVGDGGGEGRAGWGTTVEMHAECLVAVWSRCGFD